MTIFDQYGNEIRKLARMPSDVIQDTRPLTYNLTTVGSELGMEIMDETEATVQITVGTSVTLAASYSVDGVIFNYMPFFVPGSETYVTSVTASGTYQLSFPSGTKRIRLIPSAIVGTTVVTLRAVKNERFVYAKYIPNSYFLTALSGVGAAASLTIPAFAGLYNYLAAVYVTKFAAANLVASATPVNVTISGTAPGTPVLAFSAAADLQGTVEKQSIETKLKGTLGTSIIIAAPITPNVIWRINAIAYQAY
jgi:hypothetical protein